eukprot:scaffold139938_cov38-Prasinocladus_malaysianus.AAC.1
MERLRRAQSDGAAGGTFVDSVGYYFVWLCSVQIQILFWYMFCLPLYLGMASQHAIPAVLTLSLTPKSLPTT